MPTDTKALARSWAASLIERELALGEFSPGPPPSLRAAVLDNAPPVVTAALERKPEIAEALIEALADVAEDLR